MYDIKGELLGVAELSKTLKDLPKSLNTKELNKYRANSYVEYTKKIVKNGAINIKGISPITRFLAGQHDPLWVKGTLMNHMKVVVNEDGSADAGFFEDGQKIPGKDITFTQLAILQHTGYRIPLFGEKGKRVRGWLAYQGVDLGKFGASVKGSQRYLNVPPRPFMLRSIASYERIGGDLKATKEYLSKYFGGMNV